MKSDLQHSNKFRIQLLGLILLVILLILIGGYGYYASEKILLEQKKHKELEAVANLKVNEISYWYNDEIQDVENIAKELILTSSIENWLTNNDEHSLLIISDYLTSMLNMHSYYNIILKNTKGERIYSVKDISFQTDEVENMTTDSALKFNKVVSTDLYKSEINDNIYIDFISPIINQNNEQIAVIICRLNPNKKLYSLIKYWYTPSKTAETMLVKRTDKGILILNDLIKHKNAALNLYLPLDNKELPALNSIMSNEGVYKGTDYNGDEVLAHTTQIKDTPWFLITKVDLTEVYSELDLKLISILPMLLTVFVLLGVGIAWLFSNRQKFVYKKLYDNEKVFSETQKEFKTILYSIGDGIITTDKNGLIKHINHVTEELTGWKEEEAVAKPIEEIFIIVNEETFETVENPVQKVLKEGVVVGLANHTLLISKDGRKIPIADSGSPIIDENNEIIGVVLVFRDQTEERELQKQIKESEIRFRVLIENADDGTVLIGQDNDFKYISPSAKKMFGYEVDENPDLNPVEETHPEDLPGVLNILNEIVNDPTKVLTHQYRFRNKDGSYRWIESTFSNMLYQPYIEALVINFSDITERKKAEAEIIAQEERWRSLIQNAPNLIMTIDKDEKITFINHVLPGFTIENVIGKSAYDFVSPEGAEIMRNAFRTVFETGESTTYELKAYGANYEPAWYSSRVGAIYKNNEIIGLMLIVVDLTDRKKTEIELENSVKTFKDLVENSPIGIYRTTPEGKILLANTAIVQLLGFNSVEELIDNHNAYDNYNNSGLRKSFIQEIEQKGKLIRYESIWIKSDGSQIIVLENARCVRDEKGNVLYYEGMIEDVTEIRKISEELRQSEENYRLIFENQTDLIVKTDIHGNYLYVNRAFCELMGVSENEILGTNYFPIVREEDIPEIQKTIALIYEPPYEYTTAWQIKTVKGWRWISWTGKAMLDNNGEIYALIGSGHDITESKIAQDALKEAEERYRTIVEGMSIGIVIHDKNKIIFTNAYIRRLMKINGNNNFFNGKNILDFIHPEDSDIVLKKINEIFNNFENNKVIDDVIQHRLIATDGRIITVEASAIVINYYGQNALMVMLNDISNKVEAESRINLLSRAIEQSPASIIITDYEGNIEYVNPTFSSRTGYTLEEVQGRNPRFLNSGHSSDDEFSELWNTIKSGQIWKGELRNLKKDGTYVWEDVSIAPVTDVKGKIVNFIAIKEDITNYKRLNNELFEAKEKAIESDKLKTAFLQNMSHEIRTPLNGIIGYSNLLRNSHISPDEVGEFSEIIKISANRLIEIVNNILDISKIETGQMSFKETSFSLNGLIYDLYDFFIGTSKNKNVELSSYVDLEDENSFIFSDHTKLNQILINLINNAIKFTDKGSVKFGYEIKDNFITFFVSDTGIGIDEKYHSRVFERFYQTDLSITRNYEGSGLGLSISKGLVELLGGKIWFVSKENEGTTFYFTIPWKSDVKETFIYKFEKVNREDEKHKVLIAEDDKASFFLLKRLIKDYNFEILHAKNGFEAVELFKQNPDVKLILMDIRMPEMNGFEATKIIKEINPEIPIIAQTAHAFNNEKQLVFEAGCDDYISKPIETDNLYSILNKYV